MNETNDRKQKRGNYIIAISASYIIDSSVREVHYR